MTEAAYNDMTEAYVGTGRNDSKGREIGWIVGLNNNNVNFAAWVQNARKVNGEWKEFGVQQRSKYFPSQETATAWAYATAQVRRHKFLKTNQLISKENGFWVVKGSRLVCGYVSRSTISRNCVTFSQLEQVLKQAIIDGYEDIEMYFYQEDNEQIGPVYGSFSEALEYDFSQN